MAVFNVVVFVFTFVGRPSIRKDEIQQWKLVAGEMVDMLKMVRQAGNLGKRAAQDYFSARKISFFSSWDCPRQVSFCVKGFRNQVGVFTRQVVGPGTFRAPLALGIARVLPSNFQLE